MEFRRPGRWKPSYDVVQLFDSLEQPLPRRAEHVENRTRIRVLGLKKLTVAGIADVFEIPVRVGHLRAEEIFRHRAWRRERGRCGKAVAVRAGPPVATAAMARLSSASVQRSIRKPPVYGKFIPSALRRHAAAGLEKASAPEGRPTQRWYVAPVKLLEGKRALVTGVANRWSIATGIAQKLHEHGAEIALAYQGERLRGSVEKIAAELDDARLVECDVSSDESLRAAREELAKEFGSIDVLVHSIAYANKKIWPAKCSKRRAPASTSR